MQEYGAIVTLEIIKAPNLQLMFKAGDENNQAGHKPCYLPIAY